MNKQYTKDRIWSDKIYYGEPKLQLIDIFNKTKLFGHIDDYSPASEKDDNMYCIDTYINNIPCQLRIQRNNGKKCKTYGPTLRYSRSHSLTEIRKFIINYKQNDKIPKYLIWGLYDDEIKKIIQLEIVDIVKMLEDRYNKIDLDKDYKMKDDKENYEHIDNSDGTTFLVIKAFNVFTYSHE